ncbi:MAG TPA: TadE/TadG family type IV pilus assembly protein [Patescibacteria group bacterium]|nr:TadE/TadG family type IV pilus assembly protein [Patescibacteria group bacterium]
MFRSFRKWLINDEATAAVEAGFMFPLLMLVLCGTIDIGVALVINQKVSNATQTVSDLLTREIQVTPSDVSDAIIGGRMALMPYPNAPYGVDIASIKFIGTTKVPTVQWRRTENMSPNLDVTTRTAGLGDQNEGVLAVTVRYVFTPLFTSYFTNPIVMNLESFARGRKAATGYIPCSTGGSVC